MQIQFLDEKGYPAKCHICGKPVTGLRNMTVNCASSVPLDMKPVCDEHNPYSVNFVWPERNTTGKTTAS